MKKKRGRTVRREMQRHQKALRQKIGTEREDAEVSAARIAKQIVEGAKT